MRCNEAAEPVLLTKKINLGGSLNAAVTSLNHVPLYHRDDGAERR